MFQLVLETWWTDTSRLSLINELHLVARQGFLLVSNAFLLNYATFQDFRFYFCNICIYAFERAT